jgi:hypothetical protein
VWSRTRSLPAPPVFLKGKKKRNEKKEKRRNVFLSPPEA